MKPLKGNRFHLDAQVRRGAYTSTAPRLRGVVLGARSNSELTLLQEGDVRTGNAYSDTHFYQLEVGLLDCTAVWDCRQITLPQNVLPPSSVVWPWP
jgi:hypothetical protein